MAYLALIRHGESLWNAKGLWTGLTDIPLSDKGREEAKAAANKIKHISFDICFTSALARAKQTLDQILKVLNQKLPIVTSKALNERDYGELTGKNKWKIKEEFGEEQFLKWRRSWDVAPPGGESLKDVYNRVVPYYRDNILPKLAERKNILISAHGNSLRALVKYLENITDEQIAKLEIATGEVYVYDMNTNGQVISKQIM